MNPLNKQHAPIRLPILALAAALACLPAAAQDANTGASTNTSPNTNGAVVKPGVDAFFDAMAITARPGQQARFVAGDNLAGYFEGYTHSVDKGAGYVLTGGAVLRNYTSSVDGVTNDRASGTEQVLPYGHRVTHASGATETLALLSKQSALAITVTAPRPALLAIAPILVTAGARRLVDGMVVVAPGKGAADFMALAANVPLQADANIDAAAITLRSAAPQRSLTVVAAFGATAEQAMARARALVATDPVQAERAAVYAALTKSYLRTSDASYDKALNWAKASARSFVVEQFGAGIWAGLPWFRDNWGRDTFIALPGTLLVTGQFDQAKAVLENFAHYQNLRTPRDANYGRIPNRVAPGEIIYNTVDGTPWMLREALEYIRYSGDRDFAARMYQLAVPYFDGAIANYVDADGLLRHDGADTWMDARIANAAPWSNRGPRAVEIQALWYTALQGGATLARQAGDDMRARAWSALADKARASFLRLFWDGATMADRLQENGAPDQHVRPNQLMLVSIPQTDFVPLAVQARVTRNAVGKLLYPYGIASLAQDDPYFHPRHENPDYHHKDAAYHQGTIWGWNAGFTVTALNKFGYQDLAWQLTRNLGAQILGVGVQDGTLGSMSELLDALPRADGALTPSGTFAQSWSVAEFVRNGYQDYVGFHPNLPENTLAFTPAVPQAWSHFEATLPFGQDESVDLHYLRDARRWTFTLHGSASRTVDISYLKADKSRARVRFTLVPGRRAVLTLASGAARLDGRALAPTPAQPSFANTIGALRFVQPRPYHPADFPVLRGRDVLKGIIERGQYR